jgi:CheY-like chemotaxis protein
MNLAVNARDAMPGGGKLTIETENVYLNEQMPGQHTVSQNGNFVMLAISDNGVGIDTETQQYIFEPFFTTKEVGKGTGLGLATVYGIVKQSGGYVDVDSEIGRGTTFNIYLPRVAEEAPVIEEIQGDNKLQQGIETILLVEDEEMVRSLSREVLENYGYTVIEARDGVDALTICNGNGNCKVDLLMTDIIMPNMGGLELAEKLIEKIPNLKILFTSGYTDDPAMQHNVIETTANFIQKPFTPKILVQKVREVLDGND